MPARRLEQLELDDATPAPGLLALKAARKPGCCVVCGDRLPTIGSCPTCKRTWHEGATGRRRIICADPICRRAYERNYKIDQRAGRLQVPRQIPLVGGGSR